MGRRIVTVQRQASGSTGVDTYFDRVVKYIPADVTAGWVAITGMLNASADDRPDTVLLWIVFSFFLIITPLWIWKETRAPDKGPAYTQITLSTIAFAVWAFALGQPFSSLDWYQQVYGSVVLICYCSAVGLVIPKE